jgi:hypothetical protein
MNTERIGRYEIVRRLGEGGMGTTWLARDPELDRVVVLKGLRPEAFASPEDRERLRREARVVAGLDHPNIVHVYDLIEHDGRGFICMQFVQGQTLRELLREGPRSLTELHRIGTEITAALVGAHRSGIVHRDIKPENVMITPEGVVKVLDFGIAWRPVDPITETTLSAGTVMAMAPEQLAGQAPNKRSDLFAVGALLYELATGRHPFQGKASSEIAYHILNTPPVPPGTLRGDLPFEFLHLLSKCLEKNPEYRYQDAAELGADLLRFGRELQGGKPDVPAIPEAGGVVQDLRRTLTSGRVRSVPAGPRQAGAIALTALGCAVAVSFAALTLFHPEPFRTEERLVIDPATAAARSREIVERQGANLYGFMSATTYSRDNDLVDYERFLRLGPQERAALEQWRARQSTETGFASADRQEHYRVRLGDHGRLLALTQGLGPDQSLSEGTVDSANTSVNRFLVAELDLDPQRLELLHTGESLVGGRRVREMTWRSRDLLPGQAVASVTLRTAGSRVLEASRTLDLPVTITRRYNAGDDWRGAVLLVVSVALGVWIVVSAVRRGRVDLPSIGFSAAAMSAWAVLMMLGVAPGLLQGRLTNPISSGVAGLLGVALFGVLLGVIAVLALGILLGTLREQGPDLIGGLGDLMRMKVTRATWARSAAVGIPVGAVSAAISHFLPWAISSVGLGSFVPGAVSAEDPFEIAMAIVGAATVGPLLLAFGLVVVLFLRDRLRLGPWAWIAVPVLWTFLTFNGANPDFQPGLLSYLSGLVVAAAILWTSASFGLLAGAIALVLYVFLQAPIDLTGSTSPWVRIAGLGAMAAYTAAFVAALLALRTAPLTQGASGR